MITTLVSKGDSLGDRLEMIGKDIRTALLSATVVEVKVGRHVQKRSLSANSLYWVWMDAMGKHFLAKGVKLDGEPKDAMHDLMRHKFLGYEDRTIGSTVIPAQLKSTQTDRETMCAYMTQIDAWAADHGVLLPRPEDSEYAEWAKAAA